MRLSKYRPSKEIRLELSTTSMIDVVFLLLIFFLVTTTFLKPERRLRPNIQIRPDAGSANVNDLEPAIVDVLIADGRPCYRIGALIATDLAKVEDVLKQFQDKSLGAFVRLADEAPYGMAAQAVNACKQSGFSLVTLVPL